MSEASVSVCKINTTNILLLKKDTCKMKRHEFIGQSVVKWYSNVLHVRSLVQIPSTEFVRDLQKPFIGRVYWYELMQAAVIKNS